MKHMSMGTKYADRGDEMYQYEGRNGGTGKAAYPNKGDQLLTKSTQECKRMVDAKMGHPMQTGKGNYA